MKVDTVLKPHGPGLIGLACGELGRFTEFIPSLVGLTKPAGTKFVKVAGLGPAQPFNQIGHIFLAMPNMEWLFLINDDHVYPDDALIRLLDRRVSVVTGLYLSRFMPFEPIIFDTMVPNPEDKDKKWYHRKLTDNATMDMEPVIACGDGCLLIRRSIMERIPAPWWEYGEVNTDLCDHDMVLSRKIRRAGFNIWCDTQVRVGHLAVMQVVPHREEGGEWRVHLKQNGGQGDRVIDLPAAYKEGE